MAEVVASIIGISTFGIKLTDTLYHFGSTFSAARDQTSRISERITDYTTILDILSATIEDDADFISNQAIAMIQRLCDQSIDLFYDIEDHLPARRDFHGHDSISFRDKILWIFRKSRVELLLGQLEYVKSNVLLIVMTTLVGRKVRSHKRRKQKSKFKADSEKVSKDLQRQELKARNAIVQHMNAGEKLEDLKNEAARADDAAFASTEPLGALVKSNTNTAIAMISHQTEAIARFRRAILQIEDPARRQAFIVGNSSVLLEDLLRQWTTLDVAEEKIDNQDGAGKVTESDETVTRPSGVPVSMESNIRQASKGTRARVETSKEEARARARTSASKGDLPKIGQHFSPIASGHDQIVPPPMVREWKQMPLGQGHSPYAPPRRSASYGYPENPPRTYVPYFDASSSSSPNNKEANQSPHYVSGFVTTLGNHSAKHRLPRS